ncbi:MAG: putative bifunctional diguanylate cyclase/phosphodiesterase [Halocynthiibacter sp.]
MSSSVRTRLKQYQHEFWSGGIFDETWTVYPNGQPKSVLCRFRGCITEAGEMALLCEAESADSQPPEILRGSQALLYTNAMVSNYDATGACIYANPAALNAFSGEGTNLRNRILSKSTLATLTGGLKAGIDAQLVTEVMTYRGPRIHEIEARTSYDAVTGGQTLLLTEIDITEKENAKRAVEHLANHDSLTKLYNRTYFANNADRFIQDAIEEEVNAYLILFDLDRFKFINDTSGHAAGDEILKEVANRAKDFFPRGALLGRLGGDEFCILLKTKKKTKKIKRLILDFIEILKVPARVDRHEFPIDASMGMIVIPPHAAPTSFDDLLIKADLALYEVKAKGGGNIAIFKERLAKKRQRALDIEAELIYNLTADNGGLQLFFQPQVDLEHGIITGAEALARMSARDGHDIRPSEFIPIAETTGLISKVGHWVLERVFQSYLDLPDELKPYRLSVNVSPLQFHENDLIQRLKQFANMSGINPENFQIELTESALHLGDRRFKKMLQSIVNMGYSLAIDDFGIAYSNIARLSKHPIDCIKLDRSLIHQKGNEKLTRGVINMGQALNLKIIAEGVETLEQRDALIAQGCHHQQGFLYARAVPFKEFTTLRPAHIPALKR